MSDFIEDMTLGGEQNVGFLACFTKCDFLVLFLFIISYIVPSNEHVICSKFVLIAKY